MNNRYLIIASDGSAIPNPSEYTGYGSHIILATDIEEDKKPKLINNKFYLTKNGYRLKSTSKKLNWLKGLEIIEIYGYNKNSNTNNQAELDALIESLKYIKKENIEYDNLTLILDSQYVINILNRILNNEGFENLKNIEYLNELDKEIKDILNKDIEINIIKVESHTGIIENEKADMLAEMGRILNIKKKDNNKSLRFDFNEYWKNHKLKSSYFFGDKIIALKPNYIKPNEPIYMLSNVSVEEIGKPNNEVVYTILKINDLENSIEAITNDFVKESELLVPYYIDLKNLNNEEVVTNINKYLDDYYYIEKNKANVLKTCDDKILCKDLYLPKISYKALEIFDAINLKLNDFIEDNKEYIEIDLKEIYLENKKNKQVLKSKFKNDKDTHILDLTKYVNFKQKLLLKFKLTFPPRNTIKKLENEILDFKLILENFKQYYRYYTYIKLNNNNIIFTTPWYSNYIYIIKKEK